MLEKIVQKTRSTKKSQVFVMYDIACTLFRHLQVIMFKFFKYKIKLQFSFLLYSLMARQIFLTVSIYLYQFFIPMDIKHPVR